MIEVTFRMDPEPEEVDADDATGLTNAAYEALTERLIDFGAYNVDIKAVRGEDPVPPADFARPKKPKAKKPLRTNREDVS